MKRIISILIILVMITSMIPFTIFSVSASAEESEKIKTVNTGNAETDRVLGDYGFDVSLDSIEGYDPSNGNVENSPFGSAWIDKYTLMEAVYLGFQSSNSSVKGHYIEGNSEVFGSEIRPTGTVNTTDSINGLDKSIEHSVTASGDFSQDARNNGVAILFFTKDSKYIYTYLAVIDPSDKVTTTTYKLLSTIPNNLYSQIDYTGLISVAVGNCIPGNENELGISPDEIVVTYPVNNSGNVQLTTKILSLIDTTENAWKNADSWIISKDISVDTEGKLSNLTMGDLNEDGYEDVVVTTSYGISRYKLDVKISTTSNATIQVLFGGKEEKIAKAEISGMYRAGTAVCDINNDGKNNIVICGIKSANFAGTDAKIEDLSVVMDSDLKKLFSATNTSTVTSSLIDELNKTLRVPAVVVKTEQMANDSTNYITGKGDDSCHMVCYDGMMLASGVCKNEIRFVKGDRNQYMREGQALLNIYSGMLYATPTSVSRDEIFLLYSHNGAKFQIYTHPNATEMTRTINGASINGSTVSAFALANIDYDTGVLRYDGWSMKFTDPELHAILAAAPYFGDFMAYNLDYILEGSTAYSFSSSYGNGVEIEWNFGVTGEANFAVVKAEGSAGYQGSWSKSYTINQTTEFSASKESLAVVATIPVEIYSYTLFVNKPGEGVVPINYHVTVPHEKVYTTMTIPEYDKAASKNGKDTISGNALIHTDGDPSSYNYTNEWIGEKYDSDSIHQSADWYRTNTNTGSTTSSIEIEIGTEQSHGFYLSGSITGGLPTNSGGVEAGISGGIVLTKGEGKGYSASVRNITKEIHGAVEGGYGFQWRMKSFNAKIDGNEIPVITYEVKNCSTNPRMPINVSARGYEALDDNGNRIPANKITWEANSSDEKIDVSYAVMRKNSFTGALQTIATVPYGTFSYIDTDDLEFGTEYEYAVRTISNVPTLPNRYSIESLPEVAKTLSEYGAPTVQLNSESVTVLLGKKGTIGVTVEGDLTGRKIEYQWMHRLPDSYEWNYIIDATSANYDVYGTSYILDGTEYRCVVMETIIKDDGKKEIIYCYSDVIKLYVE